MNITCAILSFKSADGWTGRETDETSDLTYKKEEINLWKVAMKEQARKMGDYLFLICIWSFSSFQEKVENSSKTIYTMSK